MKSIIICKIPSNQSVYTIEIGTSLVANISDFLAFIKTLGSTFAIVSDEIVASLYAMALKEILQKNGLDVTVLTFPPGEAYKTREMKAQLEDLLLQMNRGKDTCLIALGGGVVTDLTGYLAATYCRGIPHVMIPTTLLAMVDASIGGKTGVNVEQGKNLIGCIYQPKRVYIDFSFLYSLPQREYLNGIVEIVKHAVIKNLPFFEWLEMSVQGLLKRDSETLKKAVTMSCEIKNSIVEEDEKEIGKRRLLNFGHTIGHMLESLTHYALHHGEAVAIGIVVESYLSVKLGLLSQNDFERIRKLFSDFQISLRLPASFTLDFALEQLCRDKKAEKSQARFVMINAIGACMEFDSQFCTYVDTSLVKESLEWMKNDLCCH